MKDYQINEQIRDKELRVIDENGQMIGIMSAREAQQLADDKNLDLVKVSPDANPPVCRIQDYGKFKYEQTRKEKENKKNQKVSEIKEVRTSVRVQEHDLEVKIKAIEKFVSDGDKVKVSVRFRGRELAYMDKGKELLEKIASMLNENCVLDKEPKAEGRNYVMYIAPKKNK